MTVLAVRFSDANEKALIIGNCQRLDALIQMESLPRAHSCFGKSELHQLIYALTDEVTYTSVIADSYCAALKASRSCSSDN